MHYPDWLQLKIDSKHVYFKSRTLWWLYIDRCLQANRSQEGSKKWHENTSCSKLKLIVIDYWFNFFLCSYKQSHAIYTLCPACHLYSPTNSIQCSDLVIYIVPQTIQCPVFYLHSPTNSIQCPDLGHLHWPTNSVLCIVFRLRNRTWWCLPTR